MNFQFESIDAFLQMGEHGRYVWASYGITFLFVIGLIVYSRGQRANTLKQINTQQVRQNQRKQKN